MVVKEQQSPIYSLLLLHAEKVSFPPINIRSFSDSDPETYKTKTKEHHQFAKSA